MLLDKSWLLLPMPYCHSTCPPPLAPLLLPHFLSSSPLPLSPFPSPSVTNNKGGDKCRGYFRGATNCGYYSPGFIASVLATPFPLTSSSLPSPLPSSFLFSSTTHTPTAKKQKSQVELRNSLGVAEALNPLQTYA